MFENIDGLVEREFDKAMRRERMKDVALIVLNLAAIAVWLALALTT